MKEVFIVDAIRTPVGKFGGSLKEIRPDDMAATLIKEILKRNFDQNNIPKEEIENLPLVLIKKLYDKLSTKTKGEWKRFAQELEKLDDGI